MDVAGARALKQRLADPTRAVQIATIAAVVPADALPVYHWLGLVPIPADARPAASAPAPDVARLSWRRRLGLSAS